jgi:hypothetical protein
MTRTPSRRAGPALTNNAVVASMAMPFTVSHERPSSRATAETVVLSSISRRSTNRAHRRVVEAPGRANRLLSWQKTSRWHPSWTHR